MTKTWIEKQTAETPLRFGTAGLRGICGEGAGQINSATLGAASLGLANHLLQQETQPLVLIAYDSRIDSRRFAEETACVLGADLSGTHAGTGAFLRDPEAAGFCGDHDHCEP